MSKAVLVMDMPESCDMCKITDMVNGKMYCSVLGCGELVEDYNKLQTEFLSSSSHTGEERNVYNP